MTNTDKLSPEPSRVGCWRCRGTGRVLTSSHRSAAPGQRWTRCPRCKGTGSAEDTGSAAVPRQEAGA